jgi:hypothetical protein
MSDPRILLRHDIVGHTIKNIWLTDWILQPYDEEIANELNSVNSYPNSDPNYYIQDIFIELDSGVFFQIQPNLDEYPIIEVFPNLTELFIDQSLLSSSCAGFTIVEVLVHENLPSHFLLLNHGLFIYCADCSPWSFGPKFNEFDCGIIYN